MEASNEIAALEAALIQLEDEIETMEIAKMICEPDDEWKYEAEIEGLKAARKGVWDKRKELKSKAV